MDAYALTAFVHVAGAVALLSGSVVGSPAVRAAVRHAQTRQEMRAYMALGRPLLTLEPVSALIVLVSGIFLTSVGGFWSLGWIRVAVALWLANTLIAGAVLKPLLGRLRELVNAADGRVEENLHALRWSRRWSFGGDLLWANDVAALYLMMIKPELTGSLLAVAAVNLVVIVVRVIRAGYRLPPAPPTLASV